MKNKIKLNKDLIYNILYWGSIGVVIVWIILKLLGIINSPVWQQMIPFAGLIIPFIIKGMKDAESIGLIKPMYGEIKDIRKDQMDMKERLIHVEKDMHYIRRDVDLLRKDFDNHTTVSHES